MSLAIRKMPVGLRRPSLRLAWIVTALLLLLGTATAAYGFWASITSSSNAAAAADALSPGSKPAVTASGTAVSVTWAGGTTVNGRPATGYTVTRYSAASGGTGTAATGGCIGTVTTLACTEQNVPGGTWYYTVTPTIALWSGAESPRSTGISTDSTAPVATVSSVSPTPNAAGWNNTSPVTVSITADDGPAGSGVASITYAVDGGGQQAVSGASATVPVSGDGTHTVSYFATDNAGNAGTAQDQTVKIDTAAPAAPGLSVPAYVYSGNVTTVPITGTSEADAKITLTASDAAGHSVPVSATASSTGNWSTTLNLGALDQGTVTYTATATDAAGNTGTAHTATSTKDTEAPGQAQSVTVPTYVNIANKSAVLVSGRAEVGASVTVSANTSGSPQSASGPPTASTTDGWSLNLNLDGLVDGTVTYTVTVKDAAGNTTSVTPGSTSIMDTKAPSLTFNALDYIFSTNVGNYPISGTTDSGATVNLTVKDSASPLPNSVLAMASGSTWTTSGLNLSSLKDTSLTIPIITVTATATTSDAAGNSTTINATLTKDTKAPTVTGITMGNRSGAAGKADTVTIIYSEALNPAKICPDWNGSSLDGTATLSNGADVTNDIISFAVTGTACPAPNIGTILLGGDYVGTTAAIFGSNGTASSLTWDLGSKTLTIKLGNAPTGQGILKSSVAAGTPTYNYAPTLTDLAGNPLGTGFFKAAIADASGF